MAVQFVYPDRGNFSSANNGQMINVYDILYIQYASTLTSINITAFCSLDSSLQYLDFANAADNPQAESGVYKWGNIYNTNFRFTQYPVRCSFKLTKTGNNNAALGGLDFWVTSNAASSTTFSPSPSVAHTATSTLAISGVSTTAASSTSSTSSSLLLLPPSSVSFSSSTVETGNALTTEIVQKSSSATIDSIQMTRSSSPPASYSTDIISRPPEPDPNIGLKVGIGVGSAIAILIILCLTFIIWRTRQKLQTAASENRFAPYEKHELPDKSSTKKQQAQMYQYGFHYGSSVQELDNKHYVEAQVHELASHNQRP